MVSSRLWSEWSNSCVLSIIEVSDLKSVSIEEVSDGMGSAIKLPPVSLVVWMVIIDVDVVVGVSEQWSL